MVNKITLTEAEVKVVYLIAEMQERYNMKHNTEATLYNDATLMENQAQSFGAEVAFCKMINVYPSLKHDGGEMWDCLTRWGDRIDVKWIQGRHRDNPILFVKDKDWSKGKPDAFALMCGDMPTFEFIGYMLAVDVMTNEYHRTPDDNGKGKIHHACWKVPACDLRPWIWLSETFECSTINQSKLESKGEM